MFHVPKYAYSFATSSVREFMTPTNVGTEVPQPVPITPGDHQATEDYYRDGMAVFEIESVFFRVPKCLFGPGPGKFRDLLLNEKEEDAIPLPDLTADEFRALIDFFLPYRCLNRGEPSLQHWIDLLSISTKYQLDSIRPIAIKGIDAYRPEIDPVEKYVLGAKYTIEEWKVSCFKILSQRPAPLTIEEAKKLGVVVVTEVFTEREKIRSKPTIADRRIAALPHPISKPTNPPRGLTAAPDSVSGPSKVPQSNKLSTTSGTTNTKPVASLANVIPTPPDDTTAKPTSPKVKLEPLVDRNFFANPPPVPSQRNDGRSADINLFPPGSWSFPPPVSGKTPQKSVPSGPTPTISQGQGYGLFGASASDNPFTVKFAEAQKTPRESVLPASTS